MAHIDETVEILSDDKELVKEMLTKVDEKRFMVENDEHIIKVVLLTKVYRYTVHSVVVAQGTRPTWETNG